LSDTPVAGKSEENAICFVGLDLNADLTDQAGSSAIHAARCHAATAKSTDFCCTAANCDQAGAGDAAAMARSQCGRAYLN